MVVDMGSGMGGVAHAYDDLIEAADDIARCIKPFNACLAVLVDGQAP
jgi:hypothetical protein